MELTMKKLLIMLLLSGLLLMLWSANSEVLSLQKSYYTLNSTTSSNSVNISLDNKELNAVTAKNAESQDFVFCKTYALASKDVDIQINSLIVDDYDNNGNLIATRSTSLPEFAKLNNSFTFKEMQGFTISFNPVIKSNEGISIVKNANLTLSGRGSFATPTETSEAFTPLYEQLADNFYDSYLHNLPTKKPSMIIVSRSTLDAASAEYIKWRKACGFDINVINVTTLGTNPSNEQIKQAVVTMYNNAQNKPDYLLLIGDSNVSSPFKMPTFYVTAPTSPENCATDLPFALIEGDDYFPEMLVGRLCVDTVDELQTIFAKTIRYEKVPLPNTNDWQTKGLVVAGNYSSGGTIPTTPVDMSRWVYEKWLSKGYTQVDTVFFMGQSSTAPSYMTTQIKNFINQGAQYISYRGWGSGNGWTYPEFYRAHLSMTNNGGRTPVVFSIVCDNGDFDHATFDPCFGEAWMTKGSASAPDGAVAFVGPSYLNTSTPLNNSLSSGIMRGIFDENMRIFGSAVMRGKIELYNNFPNNQGSSDNAPFYFKIYNMLSDPSLNLWKLIPATLNVTLPDAIDQSQNFVEINAPGIINGVVTSTKDNVNYNYTRIQNGYAIIPVDNTVEGNVKVTISARNYLPIQKSITINPAEKISLVSYTVPNGLIVGQTANFTLSVKNFSTTAQNNVICTVTANNEFVNITDNTIEIGNMAVGETKTANLAVNILATCPDKTQIPFTFTFSPTASVSKIMTVVGGLSVEITNPTPIGNNGIIVPGETRSIQLSVKNNSLFNISNMTTVIHPMTNAVSCSQTPIAVPAINQNESQNINFDLTVANNCFVGREAMFYADFSTTDGKSTRAYFTLTIGNVTNTAPTGPDNFGYFAYDSNDNAYSQAPTYSWIEIDPDNSGSGTQLLMNDDTSVDIDLPFNFKFYGIDYNKLTICSNGWISFIQTWKHDFNNWNIPSALGPYTMIAAYWDDLKGFQTSSTTWNPMHVSYLWDSNNNRFIIEWDKTYNAFNPNNTSEEGFQIILYPNSTQNGDILFQYRIVDNPAQSNNFATVGIENHEQNDGVLYTFANYYPASASPLAANLAIKFTTNPPDNYVGNDNDVQLINQVVLNQNYPNPFNPNTNISFSIPENSNVNLEIYNVKGQKVKTLINNNLNKGQHSVTWSGKDDNNKNTASGIYFYKLTFKNQSFMKKMLLIK